ncbi:MAG: glucosamine-6-phosphate deaminase, partial [Devosiaceae bacterium]
MKVLLFPDAQAACAAAAKAVVDQLRAKPTSVLGLATGGTMERVYDKLAAHHASGEVSFAQATSFNLDEYVSLSPDHLQSYRQTMQRLLFDHIDLPEASSHLPLGDSSDPQAEAACYEAAIAAAGGLDLQLLGIGHNGHIGFNEPTSSLGARTRIKTLTRQTRQANARYFGELEDVPRYAITMGIATILDARHCVLVALGQGKA